MIKKLTNAFFQATMNSLEGSLRIIDREFKVVFANKMAEELFHFPARQMVGRACNDPLFLDEGVLVVPELNALFKGQAIKPMEMTLKSPEGVKHFYEISMFPIKSDDGTIEAAIIRTQDITSRKLFEQEVFQREKLATLGQVSSSLAHEIRNPITGIRLGLDILETSMKTDEEKEIYQGISNDINRLDSILKHLLDYAKVRKKTKTEISINQVIEKSLILLVKEAEKRQIKIELEFSEILPKIIADETAVQQVIVNIVLNAIQAVETNGHIRIRTANVNVNDILGVEIIVKDNGCGISKEDMFKINNLFFTTKEEGTGLGLPMSQKLVREHGGSIIFESDVGVGTSAKIFLPVEI